MKKFILFSLFSLALCTACDSADDEIIVQQNNGMTDLANYFAVNGPCSPVSLEEFNTLAAGYGWKNVDDRMIDLTTGEVAPHDILGRDYDDDLHHVFGGGCVDYEIGKDGSLSTFHEAIDANPPFTKGVYDYDAATNGIFLEGKSRDFPHMLIVSLDDDKLVTISRAIAGFCIYNYMLSTFRRMTQEELEDYHKRFIR